MLRLCQNSREASESLLMLGIGLPSESENWKKETAQRLSNTVNLSLTALSEAEKVFMLNGKHKARFAQIISLPQNKKTEKNALLTEAFEYLD